MAVCSFCPLLCEYEPNQSLDCSLRRSTLEKIENHRAARERDVKRPSNLKSASTLAGGANDDDVVKAVAWLREASNVRITGRVVSVETSRAVLALAQQLNAFVDIDGSESAFHHVAAVQRAGMTTASLSEVRFRSDVVVLIGDDRLLELFPRLPERIVEQLSSIVPNDLAIESETIEDNCSTIGHRSTHGRRIAFLGNWSAVSLARFEAMGCEVASVAVEVEKIPQALHQWSRLSEDERSQSANRISGWLSEAKYLSLIWTAGLLDFSQPDLWIERLFEWIGARNETKRCTGLPLGSAYNTFQQVCTWTTGFPGRVKFHNGNAHYHPNLPRRETNPLSLSSPSPRFGERGLGGEGFLYDLEIRIDETIQDAPAGAPNACHQIHIAPMSFLDFEDRVHLACGIAGVDYDAELFRMDGTVVLKVESERETAIYELSKKRGELSLDPSPLSSKRGEGETSSVVAANSAATWLRRLLEESSC